MKKIVLVLVLILVTLTIVGCEKEATPAPTPTPAIPPTEYLLMGNNWIEYHQDGESCRIELEFPYDDVIFILPSDCDLLIQPESIHFYPYIYYGYLFNSKHGEKFYLQVWSIDAEGVYYYLPPE